MTLEIEFLTCEILRNQISKITYNELKQKQQNSTFEEIREGLGGMHGRNTNEATAGGGIVATQSNVPWVNITFWLRCQDEEFVASNSSNLSNYPLFGLSF